mmetsp:Transcript_17410/g.37588  ORF Transcript_17410/g.37588 Transcript_17410/m.37588 type:complete len:308 (+) Transcript_17410:125-1048(+)|eukprot:CAMPEP_0172539840 /NCGR_PEP_ID=MMETSP1067-20121228/10959_1 /TAXON_ID=265564 ORGANISM="Thalassiosira punctigera, Strain Tpunct2005C2" /NCGR_SAMPLE_ID=MMETSP1067 /ASSEMBLY_ACC=CAM_ASM_000444 /LENGTH=307 /DNA_ID=CAMNT_0013325583 /DNA_START=120 /DNA_END=1043 /DNA_ORIENTATION=+
MRSTIAFLGIIPIFIGGVIAESSDVGESYHLYHKLGNGSDLTPRGTIKIYPSETNNELVATFHPEKSAQLDTSAFDSMVESNALYTLVVLEGDKTPSQSNSHYVSASVPGCSLRRSNLREEIGLSVGPTGKLQSVSYRPIISPLAPKTCQKIMPLSEKPDAIFGRRGDDDESISAMPFKTTVSFDSHKPMMAIPTVLPQQRPPPGLKWHRRNSKNNPNPLLGGSNVKEGGGIPGVDDEPPTGFKSSWLYRYWYIILPMAIMGLFGGVEEEEPPKNQAGQHRGAAAASAGAVAAGGATQARQRRGKRD